ncbi:hypothetical protein Aph02nite_38350 [Actinoplanes philippinensis]|uniref:DUF58 domain-containing protein n=1 Tax=Actinoplanes philippinensis TaxID=35752 RepID=A0A1I2FNT7_9ACTN|nr:DUF58 domain-containing protein [Actinoplanes philippinensis]GIE77885.1 hypothetical protein Aph02nite_38350 [Actinoplanes philippinensis]SFF06417.1 Protein of unknown function DUF58 [Actinoplanes philippinensis]
MTTAPDRLLRRLEWKLGRRLDGRLQGSYRTVWHGAGLDFTDLRAYTPEDDVRHIDWNVTARLDEPFVRQYTEDREMTAWMVIDRSASMRFGAGKESTASDLAVAIARLISQGGNRVGAILFDNQSHKVIPPRAGRDQVLRIAREATREVTKKSDKTTDLAGMLRLAAATTAQRRSLVFVMSDFIGDPGWDRPLAQLTHRHEVVVIRVVDPAELELPDLGLILVEDAETGEQLLVDTSDPLLRARLTEQVGAREDELAAGMRRAGVDAHRITTDQDMTATLVDMVRRSGRRRR